MRYTLTFSDVATGATADTFKTLAALIVADTAGYRCRIRSIAIGPADDTPQDKSVAIKLARIADVSAGGAGTKTAVAAGNLGKKDPGAADSIISGGRNYTAEPTAYETEPIWQCDVNCRGGLIKEWSAEDAPIATADMLLGLLAAPRDASAKQLSGTIEFEQF